MAKKSEDNHIGYLLQQVSHLSQQLYNERLEREGVSFSQDRVLSLLYKNDGATQSELKENLLIKPSSLTNLINILEQKKLVSRVNNQRDGRIKTIILTEKGKQLEKKLWDIKELVEAEITGYLTENEKSSLRTYLKQVRNSLLNHDN